MVTTTVSQPRSSPSPSSFVHFMSCSSVSIAQGMCHIHIFAYMSMFWKRNVLRGAPYVRLLNSNGNRWLEIEMIRVISNRQAGEMNHLTRLLNGLLFTFFLLFCSFCSLFKASSPVISSI